MLVMVFYKRESSPLIQIDEGSGVSANFALDSNGSYLSYFQSLSSIPNEQCRNARIDSTGRIGINTRYI